MVWYGMVWYGMVWYGMVWYGMVWYGMVWYGMVWYSMVCYVMMLCYVMLCYVMLCYVLKAAHTGSGSPRAWRKASAGLTRYTRLYLKHFIIAMKTAPQIKFHVLVRFSLFGEISRDCFPKWSISLMMILS